jgi:hypothetical protein
VGVILTIDGFDTGFQIFPVIVGNNDYTCRIIHQYHSGIIVIVFFYGSKNAIVPDYPSPSDARIYGIRE